jgi:hypothetical protein
VKGAGTSVVASPGSTVVSTLNLPSGSYVGNAKLYVRAEAAGSYSRLANCTLSDGSDSDFSQAEGQPTGGNDGNTPDDFDLCSHHHIAGHRDRVVLLAGTRGTTVEALSPVVTAIRVGALNWPPARSRPPTRLLLG